MATTVTTVTTKKQSVMEGDKLVKEMYFLNIKTDKGELQINIGKKTHDAINKLNGGK